MHCSPAAHCALGPHWHFPSAPHVFATMLLQSVHAPPSIPQSVKTPLKQPPSKQQPSRQEAESQVQ